MSQSIADRNFKKKIIVSACLAGVDCRYDCRNKINPSIREMVETGDAIAVCPEQLGGLSTPRPPAEKINGRIRTETGEDVTGHYDKGAEEALRIALESGADTAYLKSKSPMCGYGKIYDGSFSGRLTDGNGVFAELLDKNKIKIISVD